MTVMTQVLPAPSESAAPGLPMSLNRMNVTDERPGLSVGEDVEGDRLAHLVARRRRGTATTTRRAKSRRRCAATGARGSGSASVSSGVCRVAPRARRRAGRRGWTRHRRPLGGVDGGAVRASVAGVLLLACHAQGRTRTGLKSKFADRVAAVLADPVGAGLELLEGVLRLEQAGAGVGGQEISCTRSAVLAPASAWSSPAPSLDARSSSSSSRSASSSSCAVLLDLLDEDLRAPPRSLPRSTGSRRP